MTERVSRLQIRQRLGDLLNRVALRNDQFIIERKGKPLAAMVPVKRLEQMQGGLRADVDVTERSPLATGQARPVSEWFGRRFRL